MTLPAADVTSRVRQRAWWIKRTVLAAYLRGPGIRCNVCGGEFRRFLPGTDDRRPNAACPRCLSHERHRRLVLFLREHTDLYSARLRMLHFAPEPCLREQFAALPNLDYVTADLLRSDVDVQLDVTDMDLPSGSVDVVLCSHVLEHVPDDRAAMRELRRILAPGGWAILDVPVDRDLADTFEDPTITTPEGRRRAFGQADHVRVYGRNFPELLRAEGWEVRVDPDPATPDQERRFGLSPGDHIYLCRPAAGGAADGG